MSFSRRTRTCPRSRPGGFTIIELAVVAAILSILVALTIGGWGKLRRASALQNAANDFSAVLSHARSRSIERQTEVWLVLYPHRMRNGLSAPSPAGIGSYFLVEDTTGSFAAGGYAAFDPPTNINVTPARLIASKYMEDYPGSQVRFIVGSTGAPAIPSFPSTSVFSPLNSFLNGGVYCNFCGGGGAAGRGAMIFNGDGTVRFVDDSGVAQITGGAATADARTGFISISEQNTRANHNRGYVFAVTKATGFITMFASP